MFFNKKRTPLPRKKKVREGEASPNDDQKNSKNQILLDQKIRQLKVPRPPSDDDKELYSIIARDVFTSSTTSEEESKLITLVNVIGLVGTYIKL